MAADPYQTPVAVAQAAVINNQMCGTPIEPHDFDRWPAADQEAFRAEVRRLLDERRQPTQPPARPVEPDNGQAKSWPFVTTFEGAR